MVLARVALLASLALVLVAGSQAAVRPAVQPGQSWDAACEAATPGDVIPVAAGAHPAVTISCFKAAPGVRFEAQGDVVVNGGLSLNGSHYTIRGVRTAMEAPVNGFAQQHGVSFGRNGSHHITLEDVDAGEFFIAADDITIRGGDYGPGANVVSKIQNRTCDDPTGVSCPPTNILIEGAFIHDFRFATASHPECLAFYGGKNVTIRNNTFDVCDFAGIFLSQSAAGYVFDGVLIEGNTFLNSKGSPDVQHSIKTSDHGHETRGLVVRNNDWTLGQEFLWSQLEPDGGLLEGNAGRIDIQGVCSNCSPGAYMSGQARVEIRAAGDPQPPPPPPPPPPPAEYHPVCEPTCNEQIAALNLELGNVKADRDLFADKLSRIGAIVAE